MGWHDQSRSPKLTIYCITCDVQKLRLNTDNVLVPNIDPLNGHNLDVVNGKVGLVRSIHLDEERADIPISRERALNLLPILGRLGSDLDTGVYRICEAELATISSDLSSELVCDTGGESGLLPDICIDVISVITESPIPGDSDIVFAPIWSTVALDRLVAFDHGLLHGTVRGEILEEPGLEAAAFEVAIRN